MSYHPTHDPGTLEPESQTARTIRLVKDASALDERYRLIGLLTDVRDSLPTTHHEMPGILRAIELLRYEVDGS